VLRSARRARGKICDDLDRGGSGMRVARMEGGEGGGGKGGKKKKKRVLVTSADPVVIGGERGGKRGGKKKSVVGDWRDPGH